MLVTISYAGPNATDLGHLLHKHPARLQSFPVSVGQAHVFYPEATQERCTVALLLEIDPVGLARNRRFGGDAASLSHYLNDRPYASSSMLAVALGSVFSSAMSGRSATHPELAAAPLNLQITVSAVPSRGGRDLAERLFEPLGWSVEAEPVPLDSEHPRWGNSRYLNLRLQGSVRLAAALRHLYVLLPVLDDAKHYWVSAQEIDKLLRSGEGWLAGHPERDLITERYLAHQRSMVSDATARLIETDDTPATVDDLEANPAATPLRTYRADAVIQALRDVGAARVADLGCGPGALLTRLSADPGFTEIIGTDVAARALASAAKRLHLDQAADRQRSRIQLLQSSLTYQDDRLIGLDAAVLMEVIEHIDPARLGAVEDAVFGHARPAAVVVTTPNADYNVLYVGLATGGVRHPDHRFEFSREEFGGWATAVGRRHGYRVEFREVGEAHEVLGAPTQLALFRREAGR